MNSPDPARAGRRAATVIRLFAGLLNVEDAAAVLAADRSLPGRLAQSLRAIRNQATSLNESLLVRFETADSAAVDTVNAYGNGLNAIAALGCSVPPAVFEAAANAFVAHCQTWADTQPTPA